MIPLFFKTRDQMGPAAASLSKNQEQSLLTLIDALCLDDEGCDTSVMAAQFCQDIKVHETRMLMEVHHLPNIFTELYLSFPTGEGKGGLLKLFRWTEKRQPKLGLGTSDERAFTIKQIPAGALRDAADALFDGMLPKKGVLA